MSTPTDTFASPSHSGTAWLRLEHWLPWLVLAFSLLVTWQLWLDAKQNAVQELQRNFDFRAREVGNLVEQRMTTYEQVLRGAVGLFASSKSVGRGEFRDFVSTLHLEKNFPGIQGVSFALVVPAAGKGKHIAAVRKEGFPEYIIKPEGGREIYAPVVYIEPFTGLNLRALGFDNYFNPERRAVVDVARDSGDAVISGKIKLMQETDKDIQAGCLMFLPVYKYGVPHNTLAQRRANIFGWIASSFRMNDLMRGILGEHSADLDIEIYDGGEMSDQTLMYDGDNIRRTDTKSDSQFHVIHRVEIAGHAWTMVVSSLPGFEARLDMGKSRFIGNAGIGTGILLALLTWLLVRGRAQALQAAQEISEREIRFKLLNEKLALTLNELESIMETNPDILYVFDLKWELVKWNSNFENFCGLAPGQMMNRSVAEFVCKEDRPTAIKGVTEVFEKGAASIEVRLVRHDGELVPYLCNGMALKNQNGEVMGFTGTGRNITERSAHEKALRESEEKYRELFDNANDLVYSSDVNGVFTSVNNKLLKVVGYARDELVGQPISKILTPENMAIAKSKMAAKLSGGIEFTQYNLEILAKDGQVIPIEISSRLIFRDGKPVGIQGIGRDITERRKREEAMRLAAIVFNTMNEAVIVTSPDNLIVTVNPAFTAITGYSADEVIRKNPRMLSAGKQSFLFYQDMWETLAATGSWQGDVWNRRKSGELYAEWLSIKVLRDENGKIANHVAIFSDISDRKKAEETLRIAAATFETHDAIMITDADANIIRVNQSFEKVTGYSAVEVTGKNPRILQSGRHDKDFYVNMWQELLSVGTWSGEVWDRRKSGDIYPKLATITAVKNSNAETTQYVSIFTDITSRKKAEDEIHNLAFYDALTGLPNRRLLIDRLNLALSVSARHKLYGALLFLDLDKFKTLNDTLGHDYGDMLLVEVAKRLKFCVREIDTVARLGGDEFVVLIENVSADAEVVSQNMAQVAEKVRAVLATPYQLKESMYHSSPSIGVCLFYGNNESVEELIKRADIAMYQAKNSGRNKVLFFDPHMQQSVETRAALESDLRGAVPDQQLRLFYQIQLGRDQRPIGAEALIRWEHPKRGMVSPAHFIPVAEESSLILEIGHWVLDTACQQIAAWSHNEQTRNLVLAVNISGKQFKQPDFEKQLETIIHKYCIEPSRLKLELTESVALDDIDSVVAKMHVLRQVLGVTLSLDDFGTGYSSLSYLKRLPLDQIKIDRSFVRDMTTDVSDAVMVKTIIDMAQNFGLNVIAEGVETEAQFTFLKENGCMAFQGYLFSKPVPLEEFEALLKQG